MSEITLDDLLDTDVAKEHNAQVKQQILNQRGLFSRVFNTNDGKAVLKQLEEFCYVHKSCADVDNPYVTFVREGRREVYLALSEILLNNKGSK